MRFIVNHVEYKGVPMYTCNACNGDFPYLIFEYNTLVCEKCSLRKNIQNCDELDAIMAVQPLITVEPVEGSNVDEEEVGEEIGDEDVTQLFDLIGKITNPQLRADFKDLAEQYFEEEPG